MIIDDENEELVIDENFDLKAFLESERKNSRENSIVHISNDSTSRYSHVDVEEVIKNPREYIIPQCIPACKALWDKNIETFMCSNFDDNYLYVLFNGLSEENTLRIKELMEFDKHFFFSSYRKAYGIKVNGTSEDSAIELLGLTSYFDMQDTFRYVSTDDYLEDYKHTGGKLYINEMGGISRSLNPNLVNATLEEALINNNAKSLYDPEEGIVFESEFYKGWHKRYLENQRNSTK